MQRAVCLCTKTWSRAETVLWACTSDAPSWAWSFDAGTGGVRSPGVLRKRMVATVMFTRADRSWTLWFCAVFRHTSSTRPIHSNTSADAFVPMHPESSLLSGEVSKHRSINQLAVDMLPNNCPIHQGIGQVACLPACRSAGAPAPAHSYRSHCCHCQSSDTSPHSTTLCIKTLPASAPCGWMAQPAVALCPAVQLR